MHEPSITSDANFSLTRKNLLKEGGWAAFGKIMTAIGTLFGIRLITEFVPKAVFGKVSLLIGVIALCGNVFAAPVLAAAQRFHSEMVLSGQLSKLRYLVIRILKWSILLASSLVLISGIFVSRLSDLSYLVFIGLTAFMVVNIIRNFEVSFLTAARRQKEVAIVNILESWLKPIMAVLLVLYVGKTPQSVIFGYLIALAGILLCFYILPVRIEGKGNPGDLSEPDSKLLRNIWSYCAPLVPLAIVGWLISVGDRYIIGAHLGAKEVGTYAIGYGLISMPFLTMSGIITQTLKPAYFQSVTNNNIILRRKTLGIWIIITLSICASGVLLIFLLRDLIVYLIVASDYRNCAILLPWIALGISFQATSHILENLLYAHNRTGLILLIKTIGAVVSLVTVYLLTRSYGLIGAAYACPIYYFCMVIAGIFAVRTIKL